MASNPNQKHSKTKNRHKKTNKHTIEFTNNTHTIKHTRISRMFSKGVSRHVSVTRASRFVHCRSAQQGKQYAVLRTSSNHATSCHLSELFRIITPFSRPPRRSAGPKPAIFMPQTTEYWPKCAPANSMFASKQASTTASCAHRLHRRPKPSRFLVKSLPSVDRGAMLGPTSAALSRPRISLNARNNDEWNPAPGL